MKVTSLMATCGRHFYCERSVGMFLSQKHDKKHLIIIQNSEKDQKLAAKIASVRSQRNQKLTETDWTQVNDAPVDKAAWATYRQALRDVPTQSGFPWDVTWPTQPE